MERLRSGVAGLGPFRPDGERRPTDLPALVRFEGRVVCCTVLDLSADGARLHPTFSGALPDEFDLRLPAQPTTRVRVIRRDDGVVGVAFGA